jgi:general stress protein YciG
MPFNSETARKAGKKGGSSNVAKHGPEHMKTIGLKGGQAMLKKYGREFYSEIGRIGKRREEGEDV